MKTACIVTIARAFRFPSILASRLLRYRRTGSWKRHWATAALSVLFMASTAFAQADFTNVVTFGDSLTQNDLLGFFYFRPQDMYGADPMEAVFDKGAGRRDALDNYASATADSRNLDDQVILYEHLVFTGIQERGTLFSLQIGGNDIRDNIDLLALYPPRVNADADAVVNTVISNIRESFVRLRRSHRRAQFVLWTVPDVTLTPEQWGRSPGQVANIRAHIQRINRYVRRQDRLSSVVIFDLYKRTRGLVANPPVLFGQQLLPPPDHGDYDNLFADPIHPTAVSNALLANSLIKAINLKWGDTIPLYTRRQLARLAHISR